MRFLIVIPTLNEYQNIGAIYKKIVKLYKKANILFIDDNSSDGSKEEILNLRKKNSKVNYIFRKKRLGIGSAHKLGIKIAKKIIIGTSALWIVMEHMNQKVSKQCLNILKNII